MTPKERAMSEPADPQPSTREELRDLKILLCQTFGYSQLWQARGQWMFERPGEPGYIEAAPLAALLREAAADQARMSLLEAVGVDRVYFLRDRLELTCRSSTFRATIDNSRKTLEDAARGSVPSPTPTKE